MDPGVCIVWHRFRVLRRYLACRPDEVHRIGRLLSLINDVAPGHGPIHLLVRSAAVFVFVWCSDGFCQARSGLPLLPMVAGPFQHFRMLGGTATLLISAVVRGFGEVLCWTMLGPCSYLTLPMLGLETRRCSEGSFLGALGTVFSLTRCVRKCSFPFVLWWAR